jgi:SH3 domain-containing protein
MVAKRERSARSGADVDASRIVADSVAQDVPDDKINWADPAFRPLHSGRPFRDQPASREPTVAWEVAASHAYRSADDQGSGAVHRRRHGGALLIGVFAVGIIIGVGTTSVLAPDQSVRILADAAREGAANLRQIWPTRARTAERMVAPLWTSPERAGHASDPPDPATNDVGVAGRTTGSEQRAAAIEQAKDARHTAPAVPPSIISRGDQAPVLSTLNTKTGGSGGSETAPSRSGQTPTISGGAPAFATGDLADVNARRSPPEAGAAPPEQSRRMPLEPLPLSPQGAQPPSGKARLRQEFEQFLSEQQQVPLVRRDRETLLAQFRKFVELKNSQANVATAEGAPKSRDGTQRFEIWLALDTTNLREHASASSTAIGTVAKGSTFRVVDRSADGKWLKVETSDGSTGYYWAARARKCADC